MRKSVSVLLLVMSVARYSEAQETGTLPDWLPDEPLRRVSYSFDTPRVIWLDDDTLIFESEEESRGNDFATFQYEPSSGNLILLDTMPLRLDVTPELIEHYQSLPNEPIYLSPFTGEVRTSIIYPSRLGVYCGHECLGGLIMFGYYSEAPEMVGLGTYEPLVGVYAQCGIQVNWANSDAAVLHIGLCYSGSNLYLVTLNGNHPANSLPLMIATITTFDQHLLAISEDGNRVLYDDSTSARDRWDSESLYYWQANLPTDSNPLPSVERTIEFSPQNANSFPFAAANFIRDDDTHILAVHTDGIIRINLDSDEREVLNPEINSNWIRLGYFSPDNRHIVLVTWNGELYVVETGIDL